MQQVKIYIISTLFILGLLVSPTISFEERVDIALKFESGVSVKKDISKGTFYSIIYISKTDSKTNLDFILSDHRLDHQNLIILIQRKILAHLAIKITLTSIIII